MKLREYLYDKKQLILFYIVIITFICLTAYFDRKNRMLDSNILYMFSVSTLFFILYLLIDFLRDRRYYEGLKRLCESDEKISPELPEANRYYQKLFNETIKSLDRQTYAQIEYFNEKAREDLEFITSWVHEIKTPIAASRLVIENSLNNNVDEESLLSIEEEIDKIEDYVQRALYYTRLNDFTKDYIIGTVSAERIVKESIKRHSKEFINKNIRVELKDLDYEISTDKKWIGFILDQILSNSLKYTPRNGKIKISMEVNDDEKLLYISDNGIGIRQEDLGRVFGKNFTGYNGRENQSSTGMGLYLSQKMARKLGHFITICSQYSKGTTVTIHFPKWSDYFDVTKL